MMSSGMILLTKIKGNSYLHYTVPKQNVVAPLANQLALPQGTHPFLTDQMLKPCSKQLFQLRSCEIFSHLHYMCKILFFFYVMKSSFQHSRVYLKPETFWPHTCIFSRFFVLRCVKTEVFSLFSNCLGLLQLKLNWISFVSLSQFENMSKSKPLFH